MYEISFAVQVAVQRPRESPDVVLAVVPSLLSAVAALYLAKRSNAPTIVWVQDLMGRAALQSGIDGGAQVATIVGSIEKWVLKRATQILVLNRHFSEYVKSIGIEDGRIALHPNWTHLAEPTTADPEVTRGQLGWESDTIVVLHTGNMGLKQDLDNVVAAAKISAHEENGLRIKFVLMGDGSQRAALQELASGIDAIQFLPPAPSAEYANILAAADILLVNEAPSSVDMSLPSKLTSYFQSGKPTIAASTSTGCTATEVLRSGAGIVVEPGDPQALIAGIHELASDQFSGAIMGAAGQRYAEQNLSSSMALSRLWETIVAVSVRAGEPAEVERKASTTGWS